MKLLSSIFATAAILPAQAAAAEGLGLRGHQPNLSTKATPKPNVFQAAISLEDFKNVDPAKFEWVNPDEIKAGETTCGFLKAPLVWEIAELDIEYPIVETYVCITFATEQPAPRGNLAVHCGGPGGLSLCVYGIWLDLDEEARSTYNIIGFDQRGMGRSTPTFTIPECAVQMQGDESNVLYTINYNDEHSIRAAAQLYKKVHLQCWNHPSFQLEAGNVTYHFLEHSGTRQLAEDIERVRRIFGDQPLSVYGISYGTVVMGVYATVFSDNVNLMVLDGSVDPNSDIVSRTLDNARANQDRLDYFFASCEFGNEQCGTTDVRTCINDLSRMVDRIGNEYQNWIAPFSSILEVLGINANKGVVMNMIISVVFTAYADMESLCQYAANDDESSFADWVIEHLIGNEAFEFEPQSFDVVNVTRGDATYFFEFNSESKPTSNEHPDSNWPFEGFGNLTLTSVAQDLITAQDMAGGAYDEDRYVNFFMKINQDYPGAGTQLPARDVSQWYSATYYWPNITPLPPVGNPLLKGVIAGQLFDPATPYIWTQKMRDSFKSATLLSSRSVNHGIGSARESISGDRRCYGNILRYLKNGVVDFQDGKVCDAMPIGSSCTLTDILYNQQCRGEINPTQAVTTSTPVAFAME
ncbi:hypothetical protein ACHAXN_004424 [Cyclotella atomus]